MFVLDEADEMLSRGFKDQIYDVFQKIPSSVQVRESVIISTQTSVVHKISTTFISKNTCINKCHAAGTAQS